MRKRAFTLVELLVVIAIISILAAMLLPMLEQSMEQSRRISCLNNTHQMHIAACDYANCYDDFYPGPNRFFGWREDFQLGTYSPSVGDTGGMIRNAWYQMVFTLSLLPKTTLDCPSMDYRVNFQPTNDRSPTHYSYRYNDFTEAQKDFWYTRAYFYSPQNARQPLFSDRWGFGRSINPPYAPYTASQNNFTKQKYAHIAGGNVLAFNGTGRFVPAFLAASGPSYSWPCEAAMAYAILRTDIIAYFNKY